MKKDLLFILVLLGVFCLSATDIGDWQNIRFSGMTEANQVFVRLENSQSAAADNTLLYYNGLAVTEQPFTELDPATSSIQSAYASVGDNADLGLVAANTGQTRKVKPVYYGGTPLPDLNQLTKTSIDPANDQGTSYLDIVADYFTFSDTKFYAAIQNRGGGFPTSINLGTTYLAYMVVITNPADPDTVWALNYMNVALGGISPGLYKITGVSSSDLVRIGNISYQITSGSNLLTMSCNISDLIADPTFAAWYDADNPILGMVSMTSRTTVIPFATTPTDNSPGATVYPKRLYNQVHPETLPLLGNYGFYVTDEDVYFEATFTDSYGRFPLSIQAQWLPGQSFELYPQSLDHSEPVIYRSADLTGLLNEYDFVPTRAAASLDNINWAYSSSQDYSYILGLQAPTGLALAPNGEGAALNWNAVTQTLLGNPVTPNHYRVEADMEPSFGTALVLGTPSVTSVDVSLDPAYRFFRVTAIKNIP